MICALIMAGGKGTRFWPLSTEEKPKQFLNLIGDKTMIQMTVERIIPIIPIERIFICTVKKYFNLVKEQVPNIPVKNIIIEPEMRNTAPCITLSALIIKRYFPNSNMVVFPADHIIKKEDHFRKIISIGEKYLIGNSENIITLGMTPDRAEIGYGYIKYSGKMNNEINNIIDVERFVEKPNKEKAIEYVKNGNYLWNSGIFMWNINNILDEIKKYIPNTYEAINKVEEINEEVLQEFINENYYKTDSISIDYAILEKSKKIMVIPSDIGWDDVGTWGAVTRYRNKDDKGNIISTESKAINSKRNITINNQKRIIMFGVDDIVTIETDKEIFITNRRNIERINEIKAYV